MPIGVILNVLAVALGGIAGCFLGGRLGDGLKEKMNWVFGACSFAMGIKSVVLLENLPAVVLAVILGTLLGLLIHLESGIEKASARLLGPLMQDKDQAQRDLLLTAVVLFCASGTGIYGALDSGMTGNHSILIAKAALDFFTAMIFACQLGIMTSFISIPQCLIMLALFYGAKVIVPLTTPSMIADFKACGGILLLATGLRIMQLRKFPIADMLPAMVLVMPFSYLWTAFVAPLIG